MEQPIVVYCASIGATTTSIPWYIGMKWNALIHMEIISSTCFFSCEAGDNNDSIKASLLERIV
jgi:hypothetical protein